VRSIAAAQTARRRHRALTRGGYGARAMTDTLGDYQLITTLGRGGMADVYLAAFGDKPSATQRRDGRADRGRVG
jgi:hypothetical protein